MYFRLPTVDSLVSPSNDTTDTNKLPSRKYVNSFIFFYVKYHGKGL